MALAEGVVLCQSRHACFVSGELLCVDNPASYFEYDGDLEYSNEEQTTAAESLQKASGDHTEARDAYHKALKTPKER